MEIERPLMLYMLKLSNHELLKWKVDEAADLLQSFSYFSDPPVNPAVTQAGLQESCGKNQQAMKSPGGEQSLGVPRTASEEATSWLKQSLGMVASPRSCPPPLENDWNENTVEKVEAEIVKNIGKHDSVSVSQSVFAMYNLPTSTIACLL